MGTEPDIGGYTGYSLPVNARRMTEKYSAKLKKFIRFE